MVMLPDGSLGILASQSYLQHSGSLLTPVELASAYRGAYSDVGQVIQSATPVVGAGGWVCGWMEVDLWVDGG